MMKQILDSEVGDMASFCAYCGYCGSEISWKGPGKRTGKRTWKRRKVVHINICQEPSILYFCNQHCKLNWIFKSPDKELNKVIKDEGVNIEGNSAFEMEDIEENTEELEKYLKDNKIKR